MKVHLYMILAFAKRNRKGVSSLTPGNQGHSNGREPPAYDNSFMWNQGRIDITPGIAHAKTYSLSSCIVFDGCHFVHCDQNTIIGASEARKRRMTPTSDGIGRSSNAKEANSELNFGDRGWLEDTIWSQPSRGRPKEAPEGRFSRHINACGEQGIRLGRTNAVRPR